MVLESEMASPAVRLHEGDLEGEEHEPIEIRLASHVERDIRRQELFTERDVPPQMEGGGAVGARRSATHPLPYPWRNQCSHPIAHQANPNSRHRVGDGIEFVPYPRPMAVVKNRILRSILLVLGFLFVGIAFLGVFLPGLPTTGPVLLAAFFFSRSSERFDHWLVSNRFFGTIVQDWRAGRGFSVRGKVIAVTAIFLSFGITTFFFIDNVGVRIGMWALAAAISYYVISRPTKRAAEAASPSTEQASA